MPIYHLPPPPPLTPSDEDEDGDGITVRNDDELAAMLQYVRMLCVCHVIVTLHREKFVCHCTCTTRQV